MQTTPLVSIVIPTFGRAKLLPKAIDSCLNQSYQNIEVIVIDDNPPHSTHRIETESTMTLYHTNPKVKYLQHTTNQGGGAARNTGIKTAKGNYISFLDDDDLYLPHKIEKQIQLFATSKVDNLGLVYCRRYSIDERGKTYSKNFEPLVRGNVFDKMIVHNYVSTPVALVKKECFDKIGLFDEKLPSRQDHDMFLRISQYYGFDYINEHLVAMLVHEIRISRNLEGKLKGWDIFFDKWKDNINKMQKKKLLKTHYETLGKISYINMDYKISTQYLKKSLLISPFNIKILILYIAAILHISLPIK